MVGSIGLTILLLVFITASTFVSDKDKGYKVIMYLFSIIISIIFSVFVMIYDKENGYYSDGQEDALKGIYKYELVEVYHNNDTIPVDTLYVKIEP
jgi:hypothetical protein